MYYTTKEGITVYKVDWDIVKGKKCPYCGNKPVKIDSKEIYGKSYGFMWMCIKCKAYVGCHPGTGRALGRLANAELRRAKQEAHKWFDGMWRAAIKRGRGKSQARKAAYNWLSKELRIPLDLTHIGMFDLEMCKQVIKLCKKYYK